MSEGQETASDNLYGQRKYRRVIRDLDSGHQAVVDVYGVLEAFGVTCPAIQHAVKKLLVAGRRGKGSAEQDIREAAVALERAIQLECQREEREVPSYVAAIS